MGNIEQELTGTSQEITKAETYNYYGDSERLVEINALPYNGTFIMVLSKGGPRDGVCIYGCPRIQ